MNASREFAEFVNRKWKLRRQKKRNCVFISNYLFLKRDPLNNSTPSKVCCMTDFFFSFYILTSVFERTGKTIKIVLIRNLWTDSNNYLRDILIPDNLNVTDAVADCRGRAVFLLFQIFEISCKLFIPLNESRYPTVKSKLLAKKVFQVISLRSVVNLGWQMCWDIEIVFY